jgi:hypothetical protein
VGHIRRWRAIYSTQLLLLPCLSITSKLVTFQFMKKRKKEKRKKKENFLKKIIKKKFHVSVGPIV